MSKKLATAALMTIAFGGPAAAIAAGQLPVDLNGAGQLPPPPVEVSGTAILGVGDAMEVEGAGIGCQITKRGGRPAIECRKAGKLKGTYTVVFDEKRARVARFRDANTAQVVYTAKHGGRARACKASRGACR
jgi:hypothetical protein